MTVAKSPEPQITRASLHRMTAEQIVTAKREGRLDAVIGGGDGDTDYEPQPVQQLTRADLARLSPAEVVAARRAGQLTDLLNGSEPGYS